MSLQFDAFNLAVMFYLHKLNYFQMSSLQGVESLYYCALNLITEL